MKKITYKRLIILVGIVLFLVGCTPKQENHTVTITSAIELVSKKADMSGYRFFHEDNHVFMATSLIESVRMFTENGTGIVYYGYAGCPWCERAVPELDKVAKEYGARIYYVDVHDPSITMEDYNQLENYIREIFDESGAFKVPEVIAIKNGKIVGHHLALVSGFSPDGDNQMNDEQKAELDQIYAELIQAVAD